MFTIQLHKLSLYGYHGVHEDETAVGSSFELSIDVTFNSNEKIIQLENTINYVALYTIVKNRFSVPEKLLETLAQNIVDDIYEVEKKIKTINISIQKLNPPILNFIGAVGITYSKSFA